MTTQARQIASGSTASLVLMLSSLLYINAVDNDLTEEDLISIPLYLADIDPLPADADYEQELAYIQAVQHAVLDIASGNTGVPEGRRREPMQLYLSGSGLCYDRSRVMEKILHYAGFQTRHVFIIALEQDATPWSSFLSADVMSHAVTEVLTQKSWMVIDSNTNWVALASNRTPVSIRKIHAYAKNTARIQWDRTPPNDIYNEPFTYLYGLHSRHITGFRTYSTASLSRICSESVGLAAWHQSATSQAFSSATL